MDRFCSILNERMIQVEGELDLQRKNSKSLGPVGKKYRNPIEVKQKRVTANKVMQYLRFAMPQCKLINQKSYNVDFNIRIIRGTLLKSQCWTPKNNVISEKQNIKFQNLGGSKRFKKYQTRKTLQNFIRQKGSSWNLGNTPSQNKPIMNTLMIMKYQVKIKNLDEEGILMWTPKALSLTVICKVTLDKSLSSRQHKG